MFFLQEYKGSSGGEFKTGGVKKHLRESTIYIIDYHKNPWASQQALRE